MYINQEESLLEEAKGKINLVEYAKETLLNNQFKGKQKTTFVEPCPKCQGHHHFAINKEDNLYHSFNGCTKGGSIVDFMMEFENLSLKEAINKTLELAGFKANHSDSIQSRKTKTIEYSPSENITTVLQESSSAGKTSNDFTSIIEETHKLANQTDYFHNRGLTDKTIEKYKLGYHPEGLNFFIRETGVLEENENDLMKAYKYILPVWNSDGGCQYFITRLDEEAVPNWVNKCGKTHNPKGKKIQLFNDRYLNGFKVQGEFLFINEGIFDAMSLEEFDYPAIALNSVENANLFLETLNQAPNEVQNKTFILIPDNDSAGERLSIKLVSGFKELGLKLEVIELPKEHKDCNDFLVANREGFKRHVQKHLNILQHTDFMIDYLDDYLYKLLHEREKSVMRTGFAGLDAKLGGGLSSGLYILGAESSIGKTTLVLQIADNIALNGDDVLFFSVEMGRDELLNRSISRELYLMNPRNKYSSQEIGKCPQDVLMNVKANYEEKIASNIAIIEANFGLGVKEVRERVEQNVKVRGKSPLVIVDYFQILKPLDFRMNEKQATDNNISELKRISRDFDIPIIAISSLNRANYRTVIGYESLKEAGSLEYSADVIIGMQLSGIKDIVNAKSESERRNLENKLKEQDPRGIDLAIIKQRNGIPYSKQGLSYFPKVNYFQEVS